MAKTKTDKYEIGGLMNGRIYVITPFHQGVVDLAHKKMGKWQDINLKSEEHPEGRLVKAWTFDASHREELEREIAKIFPPEDTKVVKTFRFQAKASYSAPELDGRTLLTFARDWHGHVRHSDVLEIIEEDLDTGGSAKHPTLGGTLVVKARVRPEATASWDDGTAEEVTE